jgi:hypothetical protein
MDKFIVRHFSTGSVGAESESNEPREKENKNTLSVIH